MKKTLLFSVIAALAFALVFTGCQQAVDYNVNVGHDSLPGPAEITATKYKGGVYLTWDMVDNAKGYEVWRQQISPNKGSPTRLGSTGRTDFRWRDVIRGDNNLAADVDYEYTVVALSPNATTDAMVSGEIVQNGKSTIGVRYEAADLPAPAAYTLEPVTGLTFKETLGGSLVASWTGDENRLVRYQVKYNTVNNNQNVITTRYTNGTSTTIENPQATTVVSVVKFLGGSSAEGNYDYYYAPSTAVSASHYIARYDGLANLSGNDFTATRTNVKTQVTITMPAIQDNGTQFVPLTGYALSKIKLGVDGVIEDWDDITIDNPQLKQNQNGLVYEFLDPKPGSDEFEWSYRLIVKLEGGKFYGLGYTTLRASNSAYPQVKAFDVGTNMKTTIDAANTDYAAVDYVINFKFEPEDGVTYTLQRKAVGTPSGDIATAPIAYGDWETITATPSESAATSPVKSRNLAYTIPAGSYRQKYSYQIIGTKAGALSATARLIPTQNYLAPEISGTKTISYSGGPSSSNNQAGAFVAFSPIGTALSVIDVQYSNAFSTTTNTVGYYNVSINGLINNFLLQGEEIEIYYKPMGSDDNYSLVGTITGRRAAPTDASQGGVSAYYVSALRNLPNGTTLVGKVKTAK